MAPSLIDEHYNKHLSVMPFTMGGYGVVEALHFVTKEFDIVRLTELCANQGEYHYFITITLLPSFNEHFQADEIKRVTKEERLDIFRAAEHIIQLQIVDTDPGVAEIIGRFAYNDFPFMGRGQQQYLGKQIKGAFLKPPYDSIGIGSTVYKFLLSKYHHLVCDNHQTVLGASMWTGTMRKYGDVMIYNQQIKGFIDYLGEKAQGTRQGFIAWDIGNLSLSRLSKEWGDRKLRHEKGACTHLLNIISQLTPPGERSD